MSGAEPSVGPSGDRDSDDRPAARPDGGAGDAPPVPIGVLIAGPRAATRHRLRTALASNVETEVVGEAADFAQAVAHASRLRPTVVLMDVQLPGVDWREAIGLIRTAQGRGALIVLANRDHGALIDALHAGASGYLLRDTPADLLCSAVLAAARGAVLVSSLLLRRAWDDLKPIFLAAGSARVEGVSGNEFSGRERMVLQLLAEGHSNREIADALSLAEVTVKKHVQGIIAKLHARDRTHAAVTAVRLGLIK